MTIEYRSIIQPTEIEQAVDLHGIIWGTDDRDAIPSHMFVALQHAGGCLLGAYDGSRVIGFAVGFPGIRDNQLLLWSHATGILPDYQGRGIGRQLKWFQRSWALENGFSCIAWTFDPLQSGNANFNIRHLGCTCNNYHRDFYGEVQDALNIGLPTDRFEVRWQLMSERVQSCSAGKLSPASQPTHCTLEVSADGRPGPRNWPECVERTCVMIPDNINQLRMEHPQLAIEWRMATRLTFERLFADGFSVVGFAARPVGMRGQTRYACYILEKRDDSSSRD